MADEKHKINSGKCPVCEDAAVDLFRPFCSKRCADIDLGRWLTGRYVISGSDDADEDGGMPQLSETVDLIDDEGPTRH